MKKRFVFILLFIISLNLSCKKTPTEPAENIEPGRRDYLWTIDTLNYPYNTIYRIWGSSPTDVWTISPGGDLDKTIFHFDGIKWKRDGYYRPLSPSAIYGFSAKDVYIGGMNGAIWHYDGSWKPVAHLTKDSSDQIVFDNMWGESSDNIYAFGAYPDERGYYNNSVITHRNNNSWELFNTKDLIGVVEHLYKNKTDEKIYLQVIKNGCGEHFDSTLIYEYINEIYKKLYGSIDTGGLKADIILINNEVYFILGNEIAKRIDDQFQTFLKIDNQNFYQRIWGRNEKDIFLFMTDGITHYNGIDIEYLVHFDKPRTQVYDSAIFENEVFFIVDVGINLIYHGKLKE